MLFFFGLSTWLVVTDYAESPGKTFADRLPKNIVTATIPVNSASVSAVSLDSKTLYVLNYGPPSAVTVINTTTNAITASIPIGHSGAWTEDLVLSPDGQILYVEDSAYNAVYMVDTATNTVTGSVPNYPVAPTRLAVSPDGQSLWQFSEGSISIVDIASDRFAPGINIGLDNAYDGVFSPDGGNVYVLAQSSKNYRFGLFQVNPNSLPSSVRKWRQSRVAKAGTTGFYPIISPDGKTVYVGGVAERAGQPIDSIAVYDVTQQKIEKEIPIENYGNPGRSAITTDGKYIFVPCNGGFVLMISTVHNRVIGPAIAVGGSPVFVAISPNGERAYVTDQKNNLVSVIDISAQ